MKYASLALDLGTRMGYAIRRGDGHIESGSVSFACDRSEGDGARFLKFRAWLFDLKFRLERAGEEIGDVDYERVDFIPAVRTGPRAVHIWGGMWAVLTAWAEHHRIAYGNGTSVSTIKKGICGNGRAKKPAVIAAVRARGYDVKDDNEADALALLLMRDRAARAA